MINPVIFNKTNFKKGFETILPVKSFHCQEKINRPCDNRNKHQYTPYSPSGNFLHFIP